MLWIIYHLLHLKNPDTSAGIEPICFIIMHRDKREIAKAKARDGKHVLDQWKACYFEVRARIEISGRDPRWEFDRKKLFEKTDYMASICQDLYDSLQVS